MLDSSMTLRYIFTFGLFLTALLISTVVTDLYYFTQGNTQGNTQVKYYYQVVYSSYIFVELCNIASQMMLAVILLRLTNEEE
ncbi:MAG: hypothetical protein ACK521_06135 [bacterium]|jgi:hypothetical protein